METKHTKGEWKAEQRNDWPYGFSIKAGKDTICDVDPWEYSTTDKSPEDVYNRESNNSLQANAKLIAAAPDMLKVLRTLKSHHPDIYIQRPDYLRIECDKAIKKATE